jgi:hypothetical protein
MKTFFVEIESVLACMEGDVALDRFSEARTTAEELITTLGEAAEALGEVARSVSQYRLEYNGYKVLHGIVQAVGEALDRDNRDLAYERVVESRTVCRRFMSEVQSR